jgi:DNA (cytosine-5)-methyltransferase 1
MSLDFVSVFAGVEAASVAWGPLGWRCKAVAENAPFPSAVLQTRFPHVPNLGDVTAIDDARIAALGRLDLIAGGSPCQDMSLSGPRTGFDGARSGLFHHQARIFHAARLLCGARWLVWENVLGALSSNGGRDFACVVSALAGCDVAVPEGGWDREGMALGEHGLLEWSVLDAQWFGLAQQRQRVFAVLDTGNWKLARSRPGTT